MQKVTITQVSLHTSKPEAPKPWKKVGIKTSIHGDKWLGCFINQFNEKSLTALKAGDVVTIEVTPSEDGKFLNFKLATRMDRIEADVKRLLKHCGLDDSQESPSEDIDPDNIPF